MIREEYIIRELSYAVVDSKEINNIESIIKKGKVEEGAIKVYNKSVRNS